MLPCCLQVGMVAVNDATLLLCCIFRVIKLIFRDHPAYMQLQDLFQEVRPARCPAGVL